MKKFKVDVHKTLPSCEIAIVVVWKIANREHMTKQNCNCICLLMYNKLEFK